MAEARSSSRRTRNTLILGLVDNAYVADDRRLGMANSIAHRLLSYSQEILLSRGRQALFGYAG